MEKLIETIDTKTTDAWGAEWDEMETARDFIQNFFDANDADKIKIEIYGKTVKISAPAEFDYRSLIYLWSDKGDDPEKIGQYGEGFKVSVLNAMRNWDCGVEVYVKNHMLEYYFENIDIASKGARAIMCKLYEIEAIHGSRLVVSNCTKRLIEAFEFGLKHFYHEKNPLLGEKLLANDNQITIYKSTVEGTGYVFYKKLMRKVIPLPIVIVSNKEISYVEKKIKHDRDRKAFGDDVLNLCLKHTFAKLYTRELKPVLLALEKFWPEGHPILNTMANSHKYWNRSSANIFPENYYAAPSESYRWHEDTIAMEELVKEVLDEYRQKNHIRCPRYFSLFGMKTPEEEASERMKKRREAINRIYSRDMSRHESQGIFVLADFIKMIAPDIFSRFANAKYTVGENDEIIGALKEKRSSGQNHIFLNKNFFVFPFNEALAVLLHEWAHIYGSDGSRSFSDALTHFISLILKNEAVVKKLKKYEGEWDNIVAKVKEEREESEGFNVNDVVKNLTHEQLVGVLNSIPQDELYKLLDRYKLI